MQPNRNSGNVKPRRAEPRPAIRPRQAARPVPALRPSSTAHDRVARCRLAACLVASHYEVPLAEVAGRGRGSRRVAHARQVAMYLAHVVCGLTLAAVGEGFRRDRTTAAYACARIEEARDDPAFDAALAGLEISAGAMLELVRAEQAA